MSVCLMQTVQPDTERPQLRLLCAYEDGGVTLWAYTNTEKELSIEGIGWDALWTSKLHVEASKYTEGRYIPLTNMMSW